MTPPLVIFDCDGVLIDSEVIACRIQAECLSAAGFPYTSADVARDFIGMTEASALALILDVHGRAVPEDVRQSIRTRTLAAFDHELRAIEGVGELLDALSMPICVASSSGPERLAYTLRLTGLMARFGPHVFSAKQVARGKPHPDLFLFAAERMGVVPSAEILVVEDSVAGVKAAVAAGMTAIGFTGGAHCPPDHGARLREAGAALLAEKMSRLRDILLPVTR